MEIKKKTLLFEGKNIRQIEYDDEIWYAVIDIVKALTKSSNAQQYWQNLKRNYPHLLSVCTKAEMLSIDNKKKWTLVADIRGIFQIISCIKSTHAEPFKLYLAQKIPPLDKTENILRIKEIYKAKGYSDEWIENQLHNLEEQKNMNEQ